MQFCSSGECFRTTVGVRQGCLLSPILFSIFLETVISDALEEHDGKVSLGGRTITTLQFAADTDTFSEEEQQLETLVESLKKKPAQGINGRLVLRRQTIDSNIQRELKEKSLELLQASSSSINVIQLKDIK